MSEKMVEAMVDMREQETLEIVKDMIERGEDPMKILDACSDAMEIVGKRFEEGEYFLPQLMMAGEMLKEISDIVKPGLQEVTSVISECKGKVLMGTVEGDIHDIGKDIVNFMLEVNEFEVRDIGIDVPAETFVEAIREFQPQVVGMCCLLTLGYDSMKNTVEDIEAAGLREDVKIMIGGGQTDESLKEYVGADAYGEDAMAAVRLAKRWTGME